LRELKRDVVNEIRDIQGMPRISLGRGSSVPRDFFESIAREMGLPIANTMPQYARSIIEHSGLVWQGGFSSEASRSGGGSTVTYEGLCAVRDAYVLWVNSDANVFNKVWSPPINWQLIRNSIAEMELIERLARPNAQSFREEVLTAYGYKCAFTGCEIPNLVEAAHVVPYFGVESDNVQNGILFRVDIHRAFDSGKFDIDFDRQNSLRVIWAEAEFKRHYDLEIGFELSMPTKAEKRVSEHALRARREFLSLGQKKQ
jgi:hypothetical protein